MSDSSARKPGDDPLNGLFVDQQPLDRALLADIVRPHVRLYGDTAEIVPTEHWQGLNLAGKVLVYLLARKVLELKQVERDGQVLRQASTVNEIAAETEIEENTVRVTLGELLEDRYIRRLVRETGDVRYYVPDHALPEISSVLGTEEEPD